MKNEYQVEEVWKSVCQTLSQQISETAFRTWVNPHQLVEMREAEQVDEISGEKSLIGVISAPSKFHAVKFEGAFSERVRLIMEESLEKPVELVFEVRKSMSTAKQGLSEESKTSNALPNTAPNQTKQKGANAKNSTTVNTSSLFSDQVLKAAQADQAAALARSFGLREDFTFDTFAVSGTNEMAHAAAIAVSNKPGTNYNPLFLYGGVGVGKTHLMHAIANNILKQNPSFKVLYCTGEEFTNEIIRGITNKKMLGFKDKYRSCQVLLIDDIQFIAGKNAVQEEFFHTFNALVKRFSQIVLTSDRPPHEINLLEDRLQSRFEAGLVVDIQQPSFELRTAILLIKAVAANLSLPMDLAQMIAAQVDSARKIEGVIKRLTSEIELKGKEINQELIEGILKEEVREQRMLLRLNPADVLAVVANHFHLKQSVIRGQKRLKEVVLARHIAMFLFKTELNLSYVEIGKWFGSRDHTSAMHAIKKINSQLNTDESLAQEINAIRMSLAGIKN